MVLKRNYYPAYVFPTIFTVTSLSYSLAICRHPFHAFTLLHQVPRLEAGRLPFRLAPLAAG